jgi:hypothetical protein
MRVFWGTMVILIAALAIAACGGSSDGDSDGTTAVVSSEAATPVGTDSDEDLPAGPPPALDPSPEAEAPTAAALVFEAREIVSYVFAGDEDSRLGSVTVGVPAGWDEAEDFSGLFGLLSDPFGPQFSVGSSCGGGCDSRTAAEWAVVAEDVVFSQFRDAENFTIEIEEDLPDGKILVATNSFGLEIVNVARWIDGRVEYFYCRFSTPELDTTPIGQFETACQGADIADLPESASP